MEYTRRKLFWGAFMNGNFYVADSNFKILAECPAFTRSGNYTRQTKEIAIKYNIDLEDADLWRDDSSIIHLQENVERYERILYRNLTSVK